MKDYLKAVESYHTYLYILGVYNWNKTINIENIEGDSVSFSWNEPQMPYDYFKADLHPIGQLEQNRTASLHK